MAMRINHTLNPYDKNSQYKKQYHNSLHTTIVSKIFTQVTRIFSQEN
jgi:hypothetical protein